MLLPTGELAAAEQSGSYVAAPEHGAKVQRVVVRRRRHRRYARRRVVVRKRPFGHSAAIGALAGGGKGAAIGALAGGAGGMVYDRATHKKRVVVRR